MAIKGTGFAVMFAPVNHGRAWQGPEITEYREENLNV